MSIKMETDVENMRKKKERGSGPRGIIGGRFEIKVGILREKSELEKSQNFKKEVTFLRESQHLEIYVRVLR